MASRSERASRRAKVTPPKPTKPTRRELCLKHNLDPEKHAFALCALAKNEDPINHKKKGPCSCHDPPMCKRCCNNCDDRKYKGTKLEVITDLSYSGPKPSPRATKADAALRIQQNLRDLEDVNHKDYIMPLPMFPPPCSLSDIGRYLSFTESELAHIPSPANVATPTEAKAFFEKDRQHFKLSHFMYKACAKVVSIAAGNSPPEVEAGFLSEVAASLRKKANMLKVPLPRVVSPETASNDGSSYGERSIEGIQLEIGFDTVSDDDSSHKTAPIIDGTNDDSDCGSECTILGLLDDIEAVEQRDLLASLLYKLAKSHSGRRRNHVYRVSRLALVHAIKAGTLNQLKDESGLRMFGEKSRKRARADYVAALKGWSLDPPRLARTRISNYALAFALTNMLSNDNVGLWSWGNKKVVVLSRDGKQRDTFVMPKIFTRKTHKAIYEAYVSAFESDEEAPASGKPLGKTIFMEIMNNVVSGDSRMLTAVDYVTGFLVHDACNMLLQIIRDMLGQSQALVNQYIHWLEITRNFLKVQYVDHARKNDVANSPSHGLTRALSRPPNYVNQYVEDEQPNTDSDYSSSEDDQDEQDDSDDDEDQGKKSNPSGPRLPRLSTRVEVGYNDDDDDDDDDEQEDEEEEESNHSREDDASEDGSCDQGETPCESTSPRCNACKFPFFFLDKLRGDVELEHRRRCERAGCSEESQRARLDDALTVIDATVDKFHSYMAHKVRVAHQQDMDAQIDQEMQGEVRRTRADGTTLRIGLDYKMKFEPKAFREPTSDHYGKRGIPWHGVIAYYYHYRCDEALGEEYVEKIVVKMDQIMEGNALQDGEAVLSNIEAFLLHAEEVFPFIKKCIISSDNAGCYHKKELVFGMAALNAMPTRRIRIQRISHTETQDGKGLIDAHFARGTKQVVMYCKSSRSAENKKVHSALELARALAWNGGIQNSCVQCLRMDRPRLAGWTAAGANCSKAALEYFARAADILFVEENLNSALPMTNPDAWKHFSFTLRVWAYSRIGDGALFRANFDEGGSFVPVDRVVALPRNEEYDSDNDSDNSISADSIFDADDDDDDSVLSEEDATDLYLDDIQYWRRETFFDAKELPKPSDIYHPRYTLTGFVLIGMTRLDDSELNAGSKSLIVEEESEGGESEEEQEEEEEDDMPPPDPRSRAALPRALAMVDGLVASNVIKINAGKDDNLAIYGLAEGFALDIGRLNFGEGWARRPLQGEIYGKNQMNDEYLSLIRELVQRGVDNKNEKMNPKQMHDVLWEKYHLYSLPSEHAIKGAVSAILHGNTKTKAKPAAKANARSKLTTKQAAAEVKLNEYMRRKVLQRGWIGMKPAVVIERAIRKGVCGHLTAKDKTVLSSQAIRVKFSTLKMARKNKRSTIEKKSLI